MKTLLEKASRLAPQASPEGNLNTFVNQMRGFGDQASLALSQIESANTTPLLSWAERNPGSENYPGLSKRDSWWASATGWGSNKVSDIAQFGFAPNVPASLIRTESSGNWGADNGIGYHGILQFGEARLTDAKRAGVVPASMTLRQFGSDTPEGRAAQVAAANWHFADIDRRIKADGLDRYVGQKVGDAIISWNGLRAMAHLGGYGGARKYIQTNGAYNPADSNGTSLSYYANRHYSAY